MARFGDGYSSVVGVDFSPNFIAMAKQMQQDGHMEYSLMAEGDREDSLKAMVPAHVDRSRIAFHEGDACSPADAWNQQYDAVLMGNLLCRLPEPRAVLRSMADLVAPSGVLMLTSPFSWKAEFCPKDQWVGGHPNKPIGADAVAETLIGAGFDPLEAYDMPLVIRHHRRFYELIGAHATLWQRRN